MPSAVIREAISRVRRGKGIAVRVSGPLDIDTCFSGIGAAGAIDSFIGIATGPGGAKCHPEKSMQLFSSFMGRHTKRGASLKKGTRRALRMSALAGAHGISLTLTRSVLEEESERGENASRGTYTESRTA